MSPGGNEPGLAPCRDGSPWSRGRHRGPKLQRKSKVELQVVLSFLPTCPLLHHPHYRTVTLVTGLEERSGRRGCSQSRRLQPAGLWALDRAPTTGLIARGLKPTALFGLIRQAEKIDQAIFCPETVDIPSRNSLFQISHVPSLTSQAHEQ